MQKYVIIMQSFDGEMTTIGMDSITPFPDREYAEAAAEVFKNRTGFADSIDEMWISPIVGVNSIDFG